MVTFNLRERLDELRRKSKMPYRKIADKVVVTENTLLALLKNNDLKVSVLERIAKVFDMDLMQFIYDERAFNEQLKKTQTELRDTRRELENVQSQRELLARLADSQAREIKLLNKSD